MIRERIERTKLFAAVATKEDLMPTILDHVPFEVCAQIDFEAAHLLTLSAASRYFYTAVSSSDQFLVARRKKLGSIAPSVCYRGQLCGPPHEAACPRSAWGN